MKVLKIAGIVFAVAVVAGAIVNLQDIRRYIRIHSM